jgi:hypothetical protein
MKILIFNQNWFADELRSLGHEVVTCGFEAHLEFQIPRRMNNISDVIANIGGASPDAIIWHDNSMPVLLMSGMDTCAIPTILYSVDTHHHHNIHSFVAPLFDHIFVAQKDYLSVFAESGTPTTWLPLWAPRFVESKTEKRFPATFVGNLIPELNPRRVAFFEALKLKIPIHIAHGNYWEIFPYAEIVVNQTVKGDLNFRVFEAMMCGATLLTERSPNGLFDLFEEGTHLVSYQPDNVEDAAAKVAELMGNPERMHAIAQEGRKHILDHHTAVHRAKTIESLCATIVKRPPSTDRHYIAMMNNVVTNKINKKTSSTVCPHAASYALIAAEAALSAGAPITPTQTSYLIGACSTFDSLTKTNLGETLLSAFHAKIPHNPMLTLAMIRNHLNRGERVHAERLAATLDSVDPGRIFEQAESTVSHILAACC